MWWYVPCICSHSAVIHQPISCVLLLGGGQVNNAALANPYTTGAHPPATATPASASTDSKSTTPLHPLQSLSLATWNQFLAVNVTSILLTSKHALPHLRAAPGGGAIINISSTRALQSEPFTEPYSATKGAVLALTHCTTHTPLVLTALSALPQACSSLHVSVLCV
jgi:NAD(P)-dependent dehydrogenase (short-subunit alcohol dehydrogenase family)